MSGPARRIFDDLLTLEVNVVVATATTIARGDAPAARDALLALFDCYDGFLVGKARELGALWNGDPAVSVRPPYAPDFRAPDVWRTNADGTLTVALRAAPIGGPVHPGAFDELRERAVETECVLRDVVARNATVDAADVVVAKRIYRTCDQIKEILARRGVAAALTGGHADLGLTADELLVVRKAWEVGVATIAVQTVVQIDGDVVTRIEAARVDELDAPLLAVHRDVLDRALEHWRLLFRTMAELAASITGIAAMMVRAAESGTLPLTQRDQPPDARLARKELITRCKKLKAELFDAGGAIVETPQAGPVLARTVIQPDGDVLCFLHATALADDGTRDAHAAAIVEWARRLDATLRSATIRLNALAAGLAAAGVAVGALVVRSWWAPFVAAGSILLAAGAEKFGTLVSGARGASSTAARRGQAGPSWVRRTIGAIWAAAVTVVSVVTGRGVELAVPVLVAVVVSLTVLIGTRVAIRSALTGSWRR